MTLVPVLATFAYRKPQVHKESPVLTLFARLLWGGLGPVANGGGPGTMPGWVPVVVIISAASLLLGNIAAAMRELAAAWFEQQLASAGGARPLCQSAPQP